jgi:hypothetical protein
MSDMDRTAGGPLVGEAGRYLEDTAPNHGGRNTRPLAIPVLATTYVSSARTGAGVAAAVLGVLAGVAAWFGLEELTSESSLVLAVVAFVLAAGLLAAATVLAVRLARSGKRLVEALRRWHQVAPEVPVRGVEVVTQQPGIARIALSGLAVVAAIAAVIVAAVREAGTSAWVGTAVAALVLLGAGVAGALGWWRVRSLLAPTAPQGSGEAFAPAPYTQQYQQSHPAQPYQQNHPAQPYQQSYPAQPYQQQAPSPQQWAPPPPHPRQPPAEPQPWLPTGAQPGGETWTPSPEVDPDLGDTRLVADAAVGPVRPPVVLLDDGRRLPAGVTTLVGRAPTPRETDVAVELVPLLHSTVSKTHAAFRVTDEAVYVTDRSSTNGTTVVGHNGAQRRLEPWTEVQVEIGGAVLLGSYRVAITAPDDLDR